MNKFTVVVNFGRLLRLSVLLCAALQLVAAQAADFSKAKQTYVPPTRIPRHIDYEALREVQSVQGKSAAARGAGVGTAGGASASGAVHHKLSAVQAGKLRLKAENLLRHGNLEQADKLLKQCFAAQPESSLIQNDLLKVNLARSRQYEKLKKLDAAAAASREAIYFAPGNAAAAALLARQLKLKGIDSANAGARLTLAQQLFAKRQLSQALVEYCQSYKLAPSAAACAGLGNVYLAAGKTALAEQQYNLALQIDPKYADACRQLRLMRLSSSDIVGANSYLGKALEFNGGDTVAGKVLIGLWQQQVSHSPGSANAHLGLARAYQLSGDLASARTEYDTVAQIEPNNATLPAARASLQRAEARRQSAQAMDAARTLAGQGAFEEAKNRIGAALANDPNNAELLLFQGELLEKMGRAGDAADAYRAVLYADPNNVEAARRLKGLSDGKLNFSAELPPLAPPIQVKTSVCAQLAEPAIPAIQSDAQLVGAQLTQFGPQPARGDDLSRLANFLVQLRSFTVTQTKTNKDAQVVQGKTKHAHAKKELADSPSVVQPEKDTRLPL